LASLSYPALDLRFAPGPGAGAFQDMLYAELDAFEPVAIQEHETGDGWRVFFRTPELRDAAGGALAAEFGNALLELVAQDVDDEDWARRSQASLRAVRIGRIVVAPPWEASLDGQTPPAGTQDPGSGIRGATPAPVAQSRGEKADPASRIPHPGGVSSRDILIIIDPSMGFGTGHHATTRLCLELLQRVAVTGRSVIDVGTGSGVLALAARALGASRVTAVDNDPDALQNARENIARNGASAIEVVQSDLSSATLPAADIVLANLTAAVLQRHAEALSRLVADGGLLIASGFSGAESEAVAAAFATAPREVVHQGEWAALILAPRRA
jgi:ribosomal protein L11 methyltransferase